MNKKLILLAILATLGFAFSPLPCNGTDNLQVGNLCLTETELQQCNDNLAELDGSATNNTSITNECEPYIFNNDTQAYRFNVSFINGYSPDLDCLDFEIKFENSTLPEGNATFDEWEYNPATEEIIFNVLHSTFEDECQVTETDDQYVWLCEMSLHITMGDEEQLKYNFKIQVTLNRNAVGTLGTDENPIEVNVVGNVVEGVCCENELGIATELKFCSDFTCDNGYLSSPLTVQRGEEFIVEHSIVTPEFQHYFLQGQQIKLGPYYGNVIETDGSQPGRYIWKIKGNIAMSNLTVESISQIHASDPNRMLSESNIRDDYQVKGTSYMSILFDGDAQQQQIQEEKTKVVYKTEQVEVQTEGNNNILMYSLIAVGALTVLSIIGATVYCMKSKKQASSQKYETQSGVNMV